jgi:hypothetical protein
VRALAGQKTMLVSLHPQLVVSLLSSGSSSLTPTKLPWKQPGIAITQLPRITNLDQGDNNLRRFIVQESYGHCVHKYLPEQADEKHPWSTGGRERGASARQ